MWRVGEVGKIRVYEDSYGKMCMTEDSNVYNTAQPSGVVDKIIDSRANMVPACEIDLPEWLFFPKHLLPRNVPNLSISRDVVVGIYQQLCHFAPLDSALQYHGIRPSLFYRTIAWSYENTESVWYKVAELLNRGFAQPMLVSLDTIGRSAASGNWQASAWYIEKVCGLKATGVNAPKNLTGASDGSTGQDIEREKSAAEVRNEILQRLTGIARALPSNDATDVVGASLDAPKGGTE
jgi:hypothetical protein